MSKGLIQSMYDLFRFPGSLIYTQFDHDKVDGIHNHYAGKPFLFVYFSISEA